MYIDFRIRELYSCTDLPLISTFCCELVQCTRQFACRQSGLTPPGRKSHPGRMIAKRLVPGARFCVRVLARRIQCISMDRLRCVVRHDPNNAPLLSRSAIVWMGKMAIPMPSPTAVAIAPPR